MIITSCTYIRSFENYLFLYSMCKKKLLIGLVALVLSTSLVAQKPYFQQKVDYKIDVRLNDEKHLLNATETLVYTNNSPDVLPFIWFHIWPNAYKNNQTAMAKQLAASGDVDFQFAPNDDRGYIDSLAFSTLGTPLKTEAHPLHIDIIKVILASPLKPGESVTITTPFRVKVPKGVYSRLGHWGQQYQITQWYPKPAVYDATGWHEMPYLNQGEFYSEFGSFEVKITLPQNYVVAATGDLQEKSEIDFINARVEETKTFKAGEKPNEFPPSSNTFKTITYKQTNVHDFAWFADKRYLIEKNKVTLPRSGKTVDTYCYFTPKNKTVWEGSTTYVNDAVFYYSQWNGDYPYNHCSAVDGGLSAGGGMEYPNVTVIGDTRDKFSLETVIMHEVGHNWFYGMLGSNERRYPWQDEGINTANEMRYIYTKYPNKGIDIGFPKSLLKYLDADKPNSYLNYLGFLLSTANNTAQPCNLPAADFTSTNYGTIVYFKTGLGFDYLKSYLGDETYDKAMQLYFDRNKYKHPTPDDLRSAFAQTTTKPIDWLFTDYLTTNKRIDYELVSSKNEYNSYQITVANRGEMLAPFSITAYRNDSVIATQWFDGFKGSKKVELIVANADYFRIDGEEKIPEVNRRNNYLRTRGLFRNLEKLNLKWLGSLGNPRKTQVFFTPIIGYNYYNGFMAGLAIYNKTPFLRKWQYHLAPMFGFANSLPAGSANLTYNITPLKTFERISIKATGRMFGADFGITGTNTTRGNYFATFTPEVEFVFKRSPKNHNNISQRINLRRVGVFLNTSDFFGVPRYAVYHYRYDIENKHPLRNYAVNVNVQHNNAMAKTWAEAKYTIRYSPRKKSKIEVRGFAGVFIHQPSVSSEIDYRFRLSGQTGFQDYTFDNTYLARYQVLNFVGQQFTETDGAFKMFSFLGQSRNFLVALNLKSPIPIKALEKLPLRIYASLGTYERPQDGNLGIAYEVGPYLSVLGGNVEVFFPGANTQAITDAAKLNGLTTYWSRIRFNINFNALNPFNIMKNLQF